MRQVNDLCSGGMWITLLRFSFAGMKNAETYLAIYLKKRSHQIEINQQRLSNTKRSNCSFQTLTLPYDNSVLEKLTLFIPYEDLV